ncbi:MAG: hypothetical protein ACK5ZV_07910 [bacterium]|jgi:hypothetical protein
MNHGIHGRFFTICPEVAGGFGENTILDRLSGRTRVHHLHYVFDGWMGDELLERTPCFIVTERLGREIEQAGLSGMKYDKVEVSTSEVCEELHPGLQLPSFLWLKVEGRPGEDDFGIGSDLRLVVSTRALDLLKRNGVSEAERAEPFQP